MNKKTLLFILGDYILIILCFISISKHGANWWDVVYFAYSTVYLIWRLFARDDNTGKWYELIASLLLIILLLVLTGGSMFFPDPVTTAPLVPTP